MENQTPMDASKANALHQLDKKSQGLRQSSGNNFLVALEGLMLAAIAWESIGKPKKIISNLSIATTAIGLGVAGIFTANGLRERAQASKIDSQLKPYNLDDLDTNTKTLEAAIAPEAPAHDHAKQHHNGPTHVIHGGKDVHHERLQEHGQEMAV